MGARAAQDWAADVWRDRDYDRTEQVNVCSKPRGTFYD